jgi:hypothetical protein
VKGNILKKTNKAQSKNRKKTKKRSWENQMKPIMSATNTHYDIELMEIKNTVRKTIWSHQSRPFRNEAVINVYGTISPPMVNAKRAWICHTTVSGVTTL